jgi:hypothetical protein
MSEIKHSIGKSSANLHPDGVQQALVDTTNSGNLANGEAAHEVPDRLGSVG